MRTAANLISSSPRTLSSKRGTHFVDRVRRATTLAGFVYKLAMCDFLQNFHNNLAKRVFSKCFMC